jgi:hypothetical protein
MNKSSFILNKKCLYFLLIPSVACAYISTKISYKDYPLEKNALWLLFNAGYGMAIGNIAMQNLMIKSKYMEFFALWGYSAFYISALIFKGEFER